MNPSPKLVIAIPTLNRRAFLAETLGLLVAQLPEAMVATTIRVFDNASEDETGALFGDAGTFSAIEYHRFPNRVGIDDSFARTVENCGGDYVLLFGDDDIPLPGFVREITRELQGTRAPAFIFVNRLIGDATLVATREIAYPESPYGRAEFPVGKFIERFTHGPGFVSSLIFSRQAWDGGKDFTRIDYDGYTFLARIYWGSKGRPTIYLGSPLLIQRRGVQAWKKEWPRYWLMSMPRILRDLDQGGVSGNSLAQWRQGEVSDFRFLVDCFVAKAYGYTRGNDFWAVSRSFQTPSRRRMSHFIENAVPSFLARWLYAKSPKMTKA